MYSSLRYSLPVALLLLFVSCSRPQVHVALPDTQPEIFPDYKGVTVPVNIAPLHFTLEGCEYRNLEARIEGQDGVVLNVREGVPCVFPAAAGRVCWNKTQGTVWWLRSKPVTTVYGTVLNLFQSM